jgi:hypothetical protein
MPRDISGNYTLPVGNPVVSGTIIDVVWANPTMSDIATQLNNVITRDGVLGATGPIRFTDGSASAPAITFTGAPATGIYRSGTTFGVSVAGTARSTLTSAATYRLIPDAAGTARLEVPTGNKLQIGVDTASSLFVDSDGLVYLGGTTSSPRVGYLGVPRHFNFGATLAVSAVGRIVYDSPVINYNLDTGVFAAGDSFWILNNSTTDAITVTPGGGFTLRFGNRSGTLRIMPGSVAFVHCVSSTEAVAAVSGALAYTAPMTVAQLPAAVDANEGMRAFVTDATSVTFGAAAVGGSVNRMPVYLAGSGGGWRIG